MPDYLRQRYCSRHNYFGIMTRPAFRYVNKRNVRHQRKIVRRGWQSWIYRTTVAYIEPGEWVYIPRAHHIVEALGGRPLLRKKITEVICHKSLENGTLVEHVTLVDDSGWWRAVYNAEDKVLWRF